MTYAERVKQATSDPVWQKFRLSLKGKSTSVKLVRLYDYLQEGLDAKKPGVTVQVDNYLKALARGGLIAVPDDGLYLLRLQRRMLRVLR